MAQFGRSSLINTAHSPGENESMLNGRIGSEKQGDRIHFAACGEDLVQLVHLVWFVWFVWFRDEINEINQIDQTNQIDCL